MEIMEKQYSLDDIEPKNRCLTDLNNDCLIYISSFLNQIERFRLALVTDVFDIAIEHYTQLYELHMDELSLNFSLVEVEELLKRFGEYIRYVAPWPDPIDKQLCNEYFNLLSIYCHRIEEIGISYPWTPDFSTYKSIFESSCKEIRKVKVYQKISAQLDDNLDELFCNVKQLSSLELLDCDIKGKHLANLVNLTELSLECCETIESGCFINLCNVVKLEKLNIAGCRLLDNRAFETILDTQNKLEELVISNNYASDNFEIVGRLVGLRKIEICECSKQLSKLMKLLDELVQFHSKDLETLQIASNFCYEKEAATKILLNLSKFHNLQQVTIPNLNFINNSESLKEIIKNCHLIEDLRVILFTNHEWLTNEAVLQLIALKSLRRLQIGPIFPLDPSLVPVIYDVLKAKNTVQLNLYLNESCVDDDLLDVLDTPAYKENENLFKIHVESIDD